MSKRPADDGPLGVNADAPSAKRPAAAEEDKNALADGDAGKRRDVLVYASPFEVARSPCNNRELTRNALRILVGLFRSEPNAGIRVRLS